MQSLVEIDSMVLKKKILKSVYVFLLFCYYLPLEKVKTLRLNRLKSPSPKDAVW